MIIKVPENQWQCPFHTPVITGTVPIYITDLNLIFMCWRCFFIWKKNVSGFETSVLDGTVGIYVNSLLSLIFANLAHVVFRYVKMIMIKREFFLKLFRLDLFFVFVFNCNTDFLKCVNAGENSAYLLLFPTFLRV